MSNAQPTKPLRRLPLAKDEWEKDHSVSLPDGSGFSLDRRDFLRLGAVAAATASLASATGCTPGQEEILPQPVRPEESRVGLALNYATTCFGCPAGCGLIAKAREGRIIKVEGNPEHPIGSGALCARGQASVIGLYDPDRVRESLRVYRGKEVPVALSTEALDRQIVQSLQKDKVPAKVRVLTGALHGQATRSLVQDFLAAFPGAKHIQWEPLQALTETVADAQKACFGDALIPQYRPERADLIVGLGAEVLDTWLSPIQFAKAIGGRRTPESPLGMSRLWVFEGRRSLTGANADKRFRVRPSQLPEVALALAHVILVEKKFGPLASIESITQPLGAYSADAVSGRIGLRAEQIREVAQALITSAGKSLVIGGGSVSTGKGGRTLEIAVNLLNAALGNDGVTVDYTRPSHQSAGSHGELAALVDEMRAGRVDVLIISGTNPVYSAPPVLGFAEAMTHVGTVICHTDRMDETAKAADYLVAAAQPLESWLDAAPVKGVVAVAQPAMRPIGQMRSLGDVLVGWGAAIAPQGRLAIFLAKTKEAEAVESGAYQYIRQYWQDHFYSEFGRARTFDTFWRDMLHSGVLITESSDFIRPAKPRDFRPEALRDLGLESNLAGSMELVLFAPHAMYDGRHANNGWLLEYPDPVTRVTWDSWVALSHKRMEQMGLIDGDICDVTVGNRTLRLAAVETPGQHDDVAGIPLGYGRTAGGAASEGVGVNGYILAEMGPLGPKFSGIAAKVTKTGQHVDLAIPQGEKVIDLSERPLIPYTTLGEYRKDAAAGTERPGGEESLWPKREYPETRWGMTVDLSACIGCGACTIACQAENNIPTAGRKGVIAGREMHWMRVDRYYRMPVPRAVKTHEELEQQEKARHEAEKNKDWLDEAEVLPHPLMCQHCGNAPCETVCPVGATTHSEDGLNMQAYNRCVGTRYCSNNCPFKARRFNWYDYSKDKDSWLTRLIQPQVKAITHLNVRWPLPLKNNPEVTVRSRGVMEKCTFCVQRISAGRGKAKDEGRKMKDGDVVTACQQTCPTQAIHFGNLAEQGSQVAKLSASKRGLHMLEEQKLETSVTYLTKVRNDE